MSKIFKERKTRAEELPTLADIYDIICIWDTVEVYAQVNLEPEEYDEYEAVLVYTITDNSNCNQINALLRWFGDCEVEQIKAVAPDHFAIVLC